MFKTDDNYNFYFDGVISSDQEDSFKKLLKDNQLDLEITNLLKIHHNFRINNSYKSHKIVLWILYEALGPYAMSIFFAEVEHPPGCEYQSRVDFYVDESGNFDYELRNSLFLYDDHKSSDECIERIAQESAGFGKDSRIRGNIKRMDLETFVKNISK